MRGLHKLSHLERNPGKAAARLTPGGLSSPLVDVVWTAPNAAEPSCDCVLGSDRNQVSVSAECKLTICESQQGHYELQETDSHDCSTYLQTRRRKEPVGSFIAKSQQLPARRRIVNMRFENPELCRNNPDPSVVTQVLKTIGRSQWNHRFGFEVYRLSVKLLFQTRKKRLSSLRNSAFLWPTARSWCVWMLRVYLGQQIRSDLLSFPSRRTAVNSKSQV